MRRRNPILIAVLMLLTVLLVVVSQVPNIVSARFRPGDRNPRIVLNQIGYQPNWPKSAFLLNADSRDAQTVIVVDQASDTIVFSLSPASPIKDKASGDRIQTLDFSSLQQPGTYTLRYGDLQSAPFKIGSDLYRAPLAVLLRSYFLQRCGTAIADPITGISHPPCHLQDGLIAHNDSYHREGEFVEAIGGWHDAGDYGKYVATTTVSLGRLLSLYEQYPDQFWDRQLTIPESGNGLPDLLDELLVGLDWLLKLQRSDGAVYRKLSGQHWPMDLAPDEDTQPRYIYGISTPETAKFAASMAMAARVYASVQPELAQSYLVAARSAWEFLETHPAIQVDWIEGDDSGSGRYLFSDIDRELSLKDDADDRLWAAAELFVTTGENHFGDYFAKHLDDVDYTLFEWKDPAPLGMIDYWLHVSHPDSEKLKTKIRKKLLRRADSLLQKVAQSGYRLANHRFVWGSNKLMAEEGITLIYAYQLTQEQAYFTAALEQLHYLLGRNHFNQTFVTGLGAHPVEHVNHLFARAKDINIPGLLVGGPNEEAQDSIAPKNLGPLSYIDDAHSYATNEYAIDYNAALIGLMTLLTSNEAP